MEPAKSKRIRRLARGVLLPFALLGMESAAHASLVISAAPTSHVTCSAGTCTAQAPDAVLNVTKLTHLLHQGDTQVVAGVAQAIDIEAPLAWTKPSRLTLSATTGITVAQPVAVQGTGAVTLTTSDTSAGAIAFVRGGKLDFWDLSSSLIINSNAYVLAKDVSTLVSVIAANPYGSFALAGDYDATADGRYKTSPIYVLYGSLNGLGHAISNVKIQSTETYAAFIAYLVGGTAPSVSNLTLAKIDLIGTAHDAYVGGLVGYSQGTISHVRMTGHVNGPDSAAVGGIVGWQTTNTPGTSPIADSSADVVVSGSSVAGGIVGFNLYGSLLRCAGAGRIAGGYAGGLVGFAEWDFGNITGSWSSAGVSGGFAGGLVGWADGNFTLADNYASGAVSAGGGLIGKNTGIGSSGNAIMRSYARGAVGGNGGGVTGSDDGTGVYTSVYWDLKTSGISNPAQGVGNIPNDPGVTGLTHAQMKSALPAGFDPAVWGQSAQVNNGYPYLLANPPPQ